MSMPLGRRFVAVDWGTTRLRATLMDTDGQILGRAASDSGVQSVDPGRYEAVLGDTCRDWFDADPALPVLMAGMVGSRNGWVEAPYASPPCAATDLARHLVAVGDGSRPMAIVPGVDCRSPDGGYDVMRGEETQAFGAGVQDGLVCLPGTHSKWVEMAAGRIVRFVTFVTGELYAALTQSFVSRLAEGPDDTEGGAALAAQLAHLPGGLTRQVFQARTQVLGGFASGRAVKPLLSRLLIAAEVAGAREVFPEAKTVRLVAAEPQLTPYRAELEQAGFAITTMEPEAATIAGLVAVAGGLDFSGVRRQP
jgi:2-dehydro-3-deoxygalactonokinase